MEQDKKSQVEKPKAAEKSIQDQINEAVAVAVAAALAAQRHQHTPIDAPNLIGRSRGEGVLIEENISDTATYTEVRYNDGMVRRDYK